MDARDLPDLDGAMAVPETPPIPHPKLKYLFWNGLNMTPVGSDYRPLRLRGREQMEPKAREEVEIELGVMEIGRGDIE